LSTAELLSWRPAGAYARCVSRVPLPAATVARYARTGAHTQQINPAAAPNGLAPGDPFDARSALHPGTASPVPASSPPSSAAAASPTSSSSVKRIQPPRLLLCHDYARGYPVWEASADGVTGDECPPEAQLWRFNHWAYVDIFVYFSHHRVTIPPVGYIHAAHRHGALVLGTLIFEWGDGAADLKTILSSFRVRAKAASQLAAIAKFFGFDGWLVNVECAVGTTIAAGDLAAFVAELTRSTRKLVGPASEVIWYDAVTRTGDLRWQNELNAENEPFFRAAGAIFTNYHWDRNAPVRSAVKAGPRRSDVFTGIDVHGRNTYGGGGFHTHVALRAIKQSGTSAALFAPSWTVESCPPTVSNPLELEERFWTGPRGKFGREAIAQYFKERPVITELPFSTFFDPGWGPRTVKNGLIVDHRRYFNMSRQDVQPSFLRTYVAAGDASAASLSLSHDAALQGSASVYIPFAFSASRMLSGTYTILRLFVASASLSAPKSPGTMSVSSHLRSSIVNGSRSSIGFGQSSSQNMALRVAYDYYVKDGDQLSADDFGLVLLCNSPPQALLLVGARSSWASDSGTDALQSMATQDCPRNVSPVVRLQILGKFVQCSVFTPTREQPVVGPAANDPGRWSTRVFDLPPSVTQGQRLSEVMIVVGKPAPQPLSVSPSPFMTPAMGSREESRAGSRYGSRLASRVASRSASRAESRRGSRSTSRNISPANSRPSSRGRSPPRADDILASIEELSGGGLGDQRSFSGISQSGSSRQLNGLSRVSSRSRIVERPSQFEIAENDRIPDDMHGSVFGNRRRGTIGLSGDGEPLSRFRQRQTHPEYMANTNLRRSTSGTASSYADAFAVDGDVDFSQLEQDDIDPTWSSSTSRVISRLSSRLGTPLTSRSGSRQLSRIGSRQNSVAVSLAVSRTGSVSNSRVTSPVRTPLTGGGGALPLMHAAITGAGIRSGTTTPSAGSPAPLKDLKSALMRAAGAMAGVASSREDETASANGVIECRVYLGSLRLEFYEVLTGGERRSSAGFDNDFFSGDAPSFNTMSPVAASVLSPRRSRSRMNMRG
jgi:mannosyl-glycoprotein endo-beta-N-acetylglucosaminidase